MNEAMNYVITVLLTGSFFLAIRSVIGFVTDRRVRGATVRRRLRD